MRIVCPRPFNLTEIIKFSHLDVNRSKRAESHQLIVNPDFPLTESILSVLLAPVRTSPSLPLSLFFVLFY